MEDSIHAGRQRRPFAGSGMWLVVAVMVSASAAYIALRPRSAERQATRHSAVGLPLSALVLRSLDDPHRDLILDDLKGKVVVVNFWGTWCPPCRKELPEIADLERQFRTDPRVRVLAVSCGSSGTDEYEALRKSTRDYLDEAGIDLPMHADETGETRRAAARAGAFENSYPTTMVIDHQGLIRAVWTGYEPGLGRRLQQLVNELLGTPAAG